MPIVLSFASFVDVVRLAYGARMPNGSQVPTRARERLRIERGGQQQRSLAAASSPTPQRQLPPLAWAGIIGAVVLLVVLVGLLALQLAVLTDSRKHIKAQDAK